MNNDKEVKNVNSKNNEENKIYSYDYYFIKQNIDMLSKFINEYKNNNKECNYYFDIQIDTPIIESDVKEFVKLLNKSRFSIDSSEQVIYSCRIKNNEYLKLTISYKSNCYKVCLYKVNESGSIQKPIKLTERLLLGYKSFNSRLINYLAEFITPEMIKQLIQKKKIDNKYLIFCNTQKILSKILTITITKNVNKINWKYEDLKNLSLSDSFTEKYLRGSSVNIQDMYKALILLLEAENQLEDNKGDYIERLKQFSNIVCEKISNWWW